MITAVLLVSVVDDMLYSGQERLSDVCDLEFHVAVVDNKAIERTTIEDSADTDGDERPTTSRGGHSILYTVINVSRPDRGLPMAHSQPPLEL